jgi:hypothetical protein
MLLYGFVYLPFRSSISLFPPVTAFPTKQPFHRIRQRFFNWAEIIIVPV